MIDIDKLYKTALDRYNKAYNNIKKVEGRTDFAHSALSDVIPGFTANTLEFGSYNQENFAVLFVDIRRSTQRAENTGAEKTFITMHVFVSAMLEVINEYKGYVIDIMGDGIMAFWGGKKAREEHGMTKSFAVQQAGLCGRDMLTVNEKVVNRIIDEKQLGSKLSIGVGVTYDSVIVTKIGINSAFDVKAFGDCINKASKYSKGENQVKVSKKVKNEWPVGKNGIISFTSAGDGEAYILHSK